MRARAIALAGGLMVIACAAVPAGLALRYPDLPMVEAAGYVVQRVGTLANEHLFTATPYDAGQSLEAELANVRQIALGIDPNLETMEPLDLALALRDMVYRRVPVQSSPTGFDYANLDRTVSLMMTDKDFGGSCGTLTIVYLALLKSFDIEARYVGMFKEAVNAPDPVISHASVEAFIEGRWIALDPTFNVSIWSGGERIGWEDARSLVLAGEPITFESDGRPLLPGRSVYDYPDPLTETMRYMIFAPTPRDALRTLPADWDGRIGYANGKRFDQAGSLTKSPVYVMLAQPAR